MAVARGDVLGSRYRVQQVVGHGTASVVYRAHDIELDQAVALKVLRDPQADARGLRREVRVTRTVTHPSVCRAHETAEDGGTRFLVRDFVEGRDLRALLRWGGPLSPELACDVAMQVGRGLGALHAAGWVHGRLSARHVLCDASHRVRIVGLRRARHPGIAPPAHRRGRGAAGYMSPEEARGQAIDARSDVYSLGVLLFELLTGQRPFRGATPVLTRLQHIHEPPPLAGPRAARVPMRILPLLEKALAKAPGERYASTDEMAAALRIAARPVVPYEPGPAPWALHEAAIDETEAEEPRRAVSRGVIAALTATAAAGLLVAGLWVTLRSPRVPPAVAVAPPPSPFVPAAIESPPPEDAAETVVVEAPPMAPVTAKPSRAEPPVRTALVRPVRNETRRWSELAPPDEVASALETRHLVEEQVTPDVEEPAPVDEGTPGRLQIGVRPWAVVRIDDRTIGETPVAPLELPPGVHTARLEHPDFQPIVRKVTVRSGETVRLQVDLGQDGVQR